jgi:hypothetical protein
MKKTYVAAAALSLSMLALGGTAGAAPNPPKAPKVPKNAETLTMTIDVANQHGPSPATASGVFNGTGTDIRTARVAGRTDHATDVFTFTGGTVTVKDVGVRSTKTDKSTRTRALTEKGVWKITRGTDAFAKAKGHGHYKATGTIQGVQGTKGCDFSAPTGSITVTATGTVSG